MKTEDEEMHDLLVALTQTRERAWDMAARVLEVLGDRRMTLREIGRALHVDTRYARAYMAALCDLRQVHVCGTTYRGNTEIQEEWCRGYGEFHRVVVPRYSRRKPGRERRYPR